MRIKERAAYKDDSKHKLSNDHNIKLQNLS